MLGEGYKLSSFSYEIFSIVSYFVYHSSSVLTHPQYMFFPLYEILNLIPIQMREKYCFVCCDIIE
jgi:hypothetical protein